MLKKKKEKEMQYMFKKSYKKVFFLEGMKEMQVKYTISVWQRFLNDAVSVMQ